MKRYGNLFYRISSFEALLKATQCAARGKKQKPGVAEFLRNIENEVIELEQELRSKTYSPRTYDIFMVRDPKERRICAAEFHDRVVHHSVCAVLEPIFEQAFIYDTYACRTSKGTHLAIKRAKAFSGRYKYYLKLDVRKFFDTIDHQILKSLIHKKIKDTDLLWLIDLFIDHPVPWTEYGKGIPIGNLTSQHFANYYLSGLDHYIKECLRIEAYLRYMDDFVLFADEKDTLWDAKQRIENYLDIDLCLKIKESALILAPVSQGLSFLGVRIFPGIIRLQRQGWRRFRRKFQNRNKKFIDRRLDQNEWYNSMHSMVSHIKGASTRNLRDAFFKGQGQKWLQPCDSRR